MNGFIPVVADIVVRCLYSTFAECKSVRDGVIFDLRVIGQIQGAGTPNAKEVERC